jgi:hypothetical protein
MLRRGRLVQSPAGGTQTQGWTRRDGDGPRRENNLTNPPSRASISPTLRCCCVFRLLNTFSPSTLVPDSPDVLKYFHEEPALLEPVTPDADPDARRRAERPDLPEELSTLRDDPFDTNDVYRGYLAGTHPAGDDVGLTTLSSDAYVPSLLDALGRAWWGRVTAPGAVEALAPDAVKRVLHAPLRTDLLVTADAPVDAERMTAVAGRAPRRAAQALQALLAEAATVFFPEPAHDGFDWTFFSVAPVRDRLVEAFRDRPVEGTRRFVLPYQKARSESKFYFDTWHPTDSPLPSYIEEV